MFQSTLKNTAPTDKVKNPGSGRISHVGQMALKEICVLGSGYSGEVKCVQDDQGICYALKVSNEKHIRFTMYDVPSSNSGDKCNVMFHEAAEYEKLRKLHALGVPVPKPLGFQINADASGIGTTSVLMELAKGQTLRDWLSERPGGKADKLCGRSQHPAPTVSDAVARIDVARSIIAALMKLRRLAFFSDFKPRNIMIDDHRHESTGEKRFSTCLVDIGGVVLYQDVSTECNAENDFGRQKVIAFQPIKDRYLIETTCSYLSPEMALVITEYDFWKRRLSNHFFRTKRETYSLCQPATQYNEMIQGAIQLEDMLKNGGTSGKSDPNTKYADMKVVVAYMSVRNAFKDAGVLNPAVADPRVEGKNPIQQPRTTDMVMVTEKASVFTMGLILVELFGGRRTGLTSLTRLRAVNDIFLGETGNAEFRMALEWEQRNPLLDESGARIPSSTGKGNELMGSNYFAMYRKHAYPTEGLLAAAGIETRAADVGELSQHREAVVQVKSILDSCLRFDPQLRPSLAELSVRLSELRHVILEEGELPRVGPVGNMPQVSSASTAKRN